MPFYNSFKILTDEIHIKKLQLKTLPPPPPKKKKFRGYAPINLFNDLFLLFTVLCRRSILAEIISRQNESIKSEWSRSELSLASKQPDA